MTLTITTPSTVMLSAVYSECHLCIVSFMLNVANKPKLLSVDMLNVVMLNVVMLIVIMLNVVTLIVIMLSGALPQISD